MTDILAVNGGSSGLKFALYRMDAVEHMVFSGALDRIGLGAGTLRVHDGDGQIITAQPLDLPDQASALAHMLAWLAAHDSVGMLDAVGHRVAHGGERFRGPTLATPAVRATLRELIPFAPLHLPQELQALDAVERHYPSVPQVVCFDTAFHRSMPDVAQRYGLPHRLWDTGIRRYGFHGLSYEYLVHAMAEEHGAESAQGRLILAHIGNGASMAAVSQGHGVETTMGFSPLGGLVMGTRPGDLDPGVLLYLLESEGLTVAAVRELVTRQSGLLGISGRSSDMRDLLAVAHEDAQAAAAVEVFCYTAKKAIGSLTAVLGGLDTLIFTGGIGEHTPEVRWRICDGLGMFGIQLNADRNITNAPIISGDGSPVTVRVMRTNEELMIARHTATLVRASVAGIHERVRRAPTKEGDRR